MAGVKSSPKDKDGLTHRDRRFAMEYLVDFNGVQAYIRACKPTKCTVKTAGTNSWKLLNRPEVQAIIKAERDKLMAESELSVKQTLDKLRQFLMYDARKVFNAQGGLLPMAEWPDDVAAAVVGVKDTVAGREVKFVDKVAALEKAMKYHGLFERDNKQQAEAISEVVFNIVGAKGKA